MTLSPPLLASGVVGRTYRQVLVDERRRRRHTRIG